MTGAPVVDAGAVDASAADVGAFTSRRTLVARRFARNRLAVAALATLEPVQAAKPVQDNIVANARPPGNFPNHL